MSEIDPRKFRPQRVAPVRHDPPGTVTAMPSPREIHHVHIYSDVNYDAMVAFYAWLLNAEIVRARPGGVTFASYDDHDHRIAIFRKPDWGPKPERAIGVSHLAFAYASLGELMYIFRRMKERGHLPARAVNHGNSTAIYYRDPDGNTVETMMDNYAPRQTKDYKRHYQWSEYFGEMDEGAFDPDRMLALYELGTPDAVLIDREEVRRLVREGRL